MYINHFKNRRTMLSECLLNLLVLSTFVKYKYVNVLASRVVSIQDEVVDKYKELCPHTDICSARGLPYDRPTQLDEIVEIPCCADCRCDENCGQHCCPDKDGLEFKLPPPVDDSSGVCTTAQYRKHAPLMQSGGSYIMTSKCPNDYNNESIQDSCTKEYFDFNFLDGMENLSPVTVKITNVTYKNRMCALCNGEHEENLIYWPIKFICEHNPQIFPSSTSMIFNTVNDDTNNCNLIFEPPATTEPYPTCTEGLIERCNVTGNWSTYNTTIDKACNSYTSWYADIYRNVHCFLCNGHSEVDVSSLCEFKHPAGGPNSFVALLDFNQLEKRKSSNDQDRCSPEKIYDPIKGKCLPLHCGHGFNLAGRKCSPLFMAIENRGWSEVVYGMTWTLVPKQPKSPQVLLLDELKQSLIQTINDTTNDSHCLIYSFIKTKTPIRRLISDMYATGRTLMTSDVDVIALKVLISESQATDVSERIRQMTKFLNINVSDYDVILRKIIEPKFDMATMSLERFGSLRTREEMSIMFTLDLPLTLFLSLESAYDEDEKGILPFIREPKDGECRETFELDSDTFCPKVKLSVSEYNISRSDNNVFINGTDKSISTETIVMSEDGTNIYVCFKDFMSMVGKQDENMEFTHTPLSILTIVLNIVSLLALAITLTIYCIFPSLRTIPGLNNMGLVISLIAIFSLSLVNACVGISTVWLCRLVGIGLHFSLLSSFCWMFVCTFHMVRVFATISERTVRESKMKLFVLYAVSSEIFSALIVIATIVTGHVLSDGDSIGYTNDPCYTDPDMMVYNVAIPVGVVIVLNFAMFLYVIFTISRLPDMRKNSSHERQNITIFIKLSTLTGLTWSFAFVYQFTGIETFAYVSTIVNASQGLFIMMSFVANKRIYNMIKQNHSEITSTSKSTKISAVGNFSTITGDHSNKTT